MPFRRDRGRKRSPIRRTEIGGIPCFWADAPPPFTATLVFRVGRCDETLPTAGITHLTEHILMPATPPRDIDRNARVEDVYATFWASGNPTRALRFLEGLAGLIASPPLERLETERSILRTEGAGSAGHPVSASAALRYGARGHGLIGFDEYGLNTVGPEEISSWVGRYFTRENAALWMTGPPPKEFTLELPSGEPMPPPEAEALPELRFPLVHPVGPDDMTVLSFDAERSPALWMGTLVLLDRAWQQIRYDRGLAYDIGDHVEVLTADTVHKVVWVESLAENVDAVRGALLQLFADIAEGGATQGELDAELERLRDDLDDPAQLPTFLHYTATEHLLGQEVSEEDYLQRRSEVTPEATAGAMRPALDRLLIAVPTEEQAPEGYERYPLESSEVVEGRVHRPAALPITKAVRRTSLIVGGDGVSFRGDEVFTVRFDELAAALRWPDGSRSLWGVDGTHIYIDPEHWRKGREAIAAVDAAVPVELVVRIEPDVILRQEHVERVASEKLKRRWVVEDELKALPDELGEGEQVLTLAEANRGLRAGLLVLTDRRLLWLYKMFGERRLDLPYAEIESVSGERGFLEAKVTIGAQGEKIEFSEIAPKERLAEIEDLVRVRAGGGG